LVGTLEEFTTSLDNLKQRYNESTASINLSTKEVIIAHLL